jgi:hypothetical protein
MRSCDRTELDVASKKSAEDIANAFCKHMSKDRGGVGLQRPGRVSSLSTRPPNHLASKSALKYHRYVLSAHFDESEMQQMLYLANLWSHASGRQSARSMSVDSSAGRHWLVRYVATCRCNMADAS